MKTQLLFSVVIAAMAAGCNPYLNFYEAVEPGSYYERHTPAPARTPSDGLRVMNWNIKFGGGRIDFFFDCFGDRETMRRSEVEANLEGLLAKIRQVDPDVLLAQEIDVYSTRSADVNMVQYILDRTNLSYAVYAPNWRSEFIPAHGLGHMNSGIAIFSRWPLSDAVRIRLPLSEEQPEYERQFYLKRAILRAYLDIPGYAPLTVLNIHADAYSKDGTKKKHVDIFKDEMDAAREEGRIVLAGGDLNVLPPGTVKLKDFPDSVCTDEDFIADDYSGELGWIDSYYRDYHPVIPLADYQADNSRYFSHTVDGRAGGFWNRTLDYLFSSAPWVPGSGLVHQNVLRGGMETMPLSDHAPVTGTLLLPAEGSP
jgi:endonuclease/exonuclease/phosphatase family metal-dependent hydrolase